MPANVARRKIQVKPRHFTQKSREMIAREWDSVAELRAEQITSGIDTSYNDVILPTVLELLVGQDLRNVIDIGCGVGILSNRLSKIAGSVTGVDCSPASIDFAVKMRNTENLENVKFIVGFAEDVAECLELGSFTCVVSNMSLMNAPDLSAIAAAISRITMRHGTLIITITHPDNWPRYWGYENAKWYDYFSEIGVEASFKISNDQTSSQVTTHFHRPLETYLNLFIRSGFELEQVKELRSTGYKYPRFLAMRMRKR